jgi:hypothetical protein
VVVRATTADELREQVRRRYARVGDLDLPPAELELVVHEAGAVHRLDRSTNRSAVAIESLAQATESVRVRRRCADLDVRTLCVEQVEVETLAAEIQTGVQHRNGPPLDSSQSTSWSVSLGRPFFMAFLRCE